MINNFVGTTLGSLLSDTGDNDVITMRINEKRHKAEKKAAERSLQKLLEDGILDLNYDNMDLLSSSHTDDTGHEDAEITTSDIIFERGIAVDAETRAMGSMLLLEKKDRSDELKYMTEADIQSLVVSTVKDSLRLALGNTGADEYDVHYEVSLFSFRPDIVVVRALDQ